MPCLETYIFGKGKVQGAQNCAWLNPNPISWLRRPGPSRWTWWPSPGMVNGNLRLRWKICFQYPTRGSLLGQLCKHFFNWKFVFLYCNAIALLNGDDTNPVHRNSLRVALCYQKRGCWARLLLWKKSVCYMNFREFVQMSLPCMANTKNLEFGYH